MATPPYPSIPFPNDNLSSSPRYLPPRAIYLPAPSPTRAHKKSAYVYNREKYRHTIVNIHSADRDLQDNTLCPPLLSGSSSSCTCPKLPIT